MAPIYLHNGGILLRNGMIAISANCCCSSSSSSSSTPPCLTPTEWRLVVFDSTNTLRAELATGSITPSGSDFILNDYPSYWIIKKYWTPLPNTYKVQVLCANNNPPIAEWTDALETYILDNYVSCEFSGTTASWWAQDGFDPPYANICCFDGSNLTSPGTGNPQGDAKGLTFYNTIDTEWTNMNNWDDGTKMQLPGSGDTVTIDGSASALSSSIGSISVDTLNLNGILGITISVQTAVTVTGSVVDSSLNSVCGKEGTLDCQGGTTVLISGTINGGTVTGANVVTFENSGVISNNGLITNVTTVIFNNNSAAYDCQIDGASVFNDTSICYGTIKANSIEFNDNAINIAGSTLAGGDNITQDIVFNDTSNNGGSVNGHYDAPIDCTINSVSGFVSDFRNSSQNSGTAQRVQFIDTSFNSGSATESIFFNSSYSTGAATSCNFCNSSYNDTAGTATTSKFYGTSYNAGITDNSTFYETSENRATANNATFEDTANNTNTGTVNTGTFKETSYNAGIANSVEFIDTSYNASGGTANTSNFNDTSYNASGGTADVCVFNETSENRGTGTGGIIFNNCAKNTSSGSITGGATFNNDSYNDGTVDGSAFSTNAINNGTINGNATFSSSSSPPKCYNNGTINGNATFSGTSFNYGTVTGTVTYNGYTGFINPFTDACGVFRGVSGYFIGGELTTLDSSGNGCWNGVPYSGGVPQPGPC